MATFEAGETVILEQVVADAVSLGLRDVDSLVVDITYPDGLSAVAAGVMTHDGLGRYHYDYQTATSTPLGVYEVLYQATSGARITRQRDSFEVHS